MQKIIDDIKRAIKDEQGNTVAYDTQAEVLRVEGETAWVKIPGGVDETPVRQTIACNAGDLVQVRVSGGTAWITGNLSAPPTDDRKVDELGKEVRRAQVDISNLYNFSGAAVSGNEPQYVWHTVTGSDTGTHIAQTTEDEFTANPKGGNLLLRSNGLAVRDGLAEWATVTAGGAEFRGVQSGAAASGTKLRVLPNGMAIDWKPKGGTWDEGSPVFRVQSVGDSYVMDVDIGTDNSLPNKGGFVFGTENVAEESGFAMGVGNHSTGLGSCAIGSYNECFGGVTIGLYNHCTSEIMAGYGLYSGWGDVEGFACGHYNNPAQNNNVDNIFCIGGGSGTSDRFNAMIVRNNGYVFHAEHTSQQGAHFSYSRTATVSSSTSFAAHGSTFPIEVGRWILTAQASFPTGKATGLAAIKLQVGGSDVSGANARVPMSANGAVRPCFATPLTITAPTTGRIWSTQSSGSSQSVTANIGLMRVW